MRKLTKKTLVALVLVAAMLLAACNFVSVNPERDLDTVVAVVSGEKITKRMVLNEYSRQKSIMGVTDEIEADPFYESVIRSTQKNLLDRMVESIVKREIAKDLGFYPLTAQQQQRVEEKADEYRQARIDDVLSYYDGIEILDENDEAKSLDYLEMATKAVDEMMETSYPVSREMDIRYAEREVIDELLADYYAKDVVVTEEDVKAHYEERLEMQKEDFAADTTWVVRFLTLESFKSDTLVYYPGDVVRVKQVLLGIDESTQAEIRRLRANGDTEGADALREQALAELKPQAEQVLQRAKNGEDFDELIVEYGQDPGLSTETQREEGYVIAKHSMNYNVTFQEAALELQKAGDLSPLVATDFGYHIIMAIDTYPEKTIPYEEVSDRLRNYVQDQREMAALSQAVSAKQEEMPIEKYEDRITEKGIFLTTGLTDEVLWED